MGCRSRLVVGTKEQDCKLEREIAWMCLKIGLRDIYGRKKQRGIRQKRGALLETREFIHHPASPETCSENSCMSVMRMELWTHQWSPI